MANTLITPSWITKSVAAGYLNEIKFVSHFDRQYDDQYSVAGAKLGFTVNARMPVRFMATHGQALQVQPIYETSIPITLNDQINTAWSYSSASGTMEIQDVRERYVNPAAETIANACDVLAYATVTRDVWNSVGTPGTTPSTTLTYLQAGVKLTDGAVGMGRRDAVLDPLAMATIANTSTTLFNPQSTISANYRNGQFAGAQLGMDGWFQDPNAYAFTTGTFTASTPLVNGANQTGTSLITDGWASGGAFLKKGDVFTIGGVYSVNPVSYTSTGRLQQFVITADINDTTGAMTIGISPSIITSGPLQTVTNSPADDAVITVWSANPAGGTLATTVAKQSMIFTKDAFAFVMADLMKPNGGAEVAHVRSKSFGISIRMVSQYQIQSDQNPTRLDILVGAATVQPRFAVRVQG